MSARLTVRLNKALQRWTEDGGSEQAVTARALIVLGAAAAGLPGAQREAQRLLAADLAPELLFLLSELAANRQPIGSQPAATNEYSSSLEAAPADELGDPLGDPLMNVGIEV